MSTQTTRDGYGGAGKVSEGALYASLAYIDRQLRDADSLADRLTLQSMRYAVQGLILAAAPAVGGRARGEGQGVTLAALQRANVVRQAEWCAGGDPEPDLAFRGNELAGETGEACNVIKKLERERHGWRGSRATKEQLAEELADVVICASLCAITAGLDLDGAVIAKFNATSEKQGLETRLPASPSQGSDTRAGGEETQGAPASPSGHSRAEPSGLGPKAECPSRGRLREALARILTMHEAGDMQIEAQEAIDSLPETRAAWMAKLSSAVASERYEAAMWLGDHADPEAIAALQALAARENNKTVRAALRSALSDVAAPADEHPQGEDAHGAAEARSAASAVGCSSRGPADGPLFVDTTGPSAYREHEPVQERQAITAIVESTDGQYWLGLAWECGWETFLTGGVEPGQTPEQAALAELAEETGYTDAEVVGVLGPTQSKFWHIPKAVNRHARFTNLHLRLRSVARRPVAAKEAALHRVMWLTPEEMATFRLPQAHHHSWIELRERGSAPADRSPEGGETQRGSTEGESAVTEGQAPDWQPTDWSALADVLDAGPDALRELSPAQSTPAPGADLAGLSAKATQGLSTVHEGQPDDHGEHGGGGFTFCLGGTRRTGGGRVIYRFGFAEDIYPEHDPKDWAEAEATIKLLSGLWNAYRSGALVPTSVQPALAGDPTGWTPNAAYDVRETWPPQGHPLASLFHNARLYAGHRRAQYEGVLRYLAGNPPALAGGREAIARALFEHDEQLRDFNGGGVKWAQWLEHYDKFPSRKIWDEILTYRSRADAVLALAQAPAQPDTAALRGEEDWRGIKAFREAAMEAIQDLRHAAACNFTPEYSGALGEARLNSFYEAIRAVEGLPWPPAPPSVPEAGRAEL